MTALIHAVWRVSRYLRPLTHRYNRASRTWSPRRWARRLRLDGHPWLWCQCGDGLGTWAEVRRWKCMTCQWVDSQGREDVSGK